MEDQWAVVLNAYQDQPDLAFILAQNFQVMKDVLETGPSGAKQIIESFEGAIETLFPLSEYHKAGREFFLLAVKGTLRPAFDLTKLANRLAQKPTVTKLIECGYESGYRSEN